MSEWHRLEGFVYGLDPAEVMAVFHEGLAVVQKRADKPVYCDVIRVFNREGDLLAGMGSNIYPDFPLGFR